MPDYLAGVYCTLYTVHCILHTVYCTLYTVYEYFEFLLSHSFMQFLQYVHLYVYFGQTSSHWS